MRVPFSLLSSPTSLLSPTLRFTFMLSFIPFSHLCHQKNTVPTKISAIKQKVIRFNSIMEKKFTRLSFGEKRHTEKELTVFSNADWGPQTHRRCLHRVLGCRLGSPGPKSYITLCREQREECVYCPRGKGAGDKEDE